MYSSTLPSTSAVDEGGWSTRRPGRYTPGIHCTVSWVCPRAGLDGCGKSRPPNGIRSPDRPARSESLYRLSHPGPSVESCRRAETKLFDIVLKEIGV
jgi:hypothetical protein